MKLRHWAPSYMSNEKNKIVGDKIKSNSSLNKLICLHNTSETSLFPETLPSREKLHEIGFVNRPSNQKHGLLLGSAGAGSSTITSKLSGMSFLDRGVNALNNQNMSSAGANSSKMKNTDSNNSGEESRRTRHGIMGNSNLNSGQIAAPGPGLFDRHNMNNHMCQQPQGEAFIPVNPNSNNPWTKDRIGLFHTFA